MMRRSTVVYMMRDWHEKERVMRRVGRKGSWQG